MVVEGSAGEPVDGALISLLTDTDTDDRVDAAFTDPRGLFLLQAPTTGSYRVRIERIGFESWTSGIISLAEAESRTIEFELPIRPVRLAALDVRVRRQCVDDPREAPQIEIVWDEARKALEAALLAEQEGLFRFNSVLFDRQVTEWGLDLVSVRTESVDGVRETPFRSLPAERLSAEGYIQEEGDDIFYYAPDASVLLSEEFMADHCFGLDRADDDGRRLVGLSFEPREDRELSDLSGVLWLDEETAALERVEFEYENIPYEGVNDDRIGGEIEFIRLPGGAFAVKDWFIRMPVLLREGRRGRLRIFGFTEYGGQLREVLDPEGRAVPWSPGASIRGVILNPFTGEPLSDATLTLDRPRGRDLTGHTGARGQYFFGDLQPGRHRITFVHPILATIDWRPDRRQVELAEGDQAEVSFTLPTPTKLRDARCGDDEEGGVVLGRVWDVKTGLPYTRARVEAEWTEPRPDGSGFETRVERTRTGSEGRYRLCGIPLDTPVTIFLDGGGDIATGRHVRLGRSAAIVDFGLERP